jgi:hypothetical protein
MSVKDEAENILENVQEVVSGKEEAKDILENIQPPLTLEDIDEKTRQVARTLTKNRVGFYALGMGVGAITGYFVAKRVLQTKYAKIADSEISEMQEHYREKAKALEAEAAKKPVDEIVKERGYSALAGEHAPPPMAVQPPTPPRVIEAEDETAGEPPDIPGEDESPVRNIFQHNDIVEHEWNWHEERRSRSTDVPYVIHVDEKEEFDYQSQTLTYYEGDDVLCNERDEVVDPDERDNVVGEGNLFRFGHGSGDPAIVYIRNDRLELIYEVIRSPNRYAEEVHGFRHYTESYKNLERMRARERDEQDE